jgi:hypothetical protein
MRQLLLAATALLVLGCASAPAVEPEATTAYAPTTKAEAESLQAALELGYKVVDEDGRVLFCRSQKKLGSHIRRETTCLTEEEILIAREASQRNVDNIKRNVPIPQGLEGGR